MTPQPHATIDRTREHLDGADGRFRYSVPLVGDLPDAIADELFHELRAEIDRRQGEGGRARLERVTSRVQDGEIQVILHGDAAAIEAWTGAEPHFADALEAALAAVQAGRD